jgi:hypothetical protein
VKLSTVNMSMRSVDHHWEVDFVPEWSNMYKDHGKYKLTGGRVGLRKQ